MPPEPADDLPFEVRSGSDSGSPGSSPGGSDTGGATVGGADSGLGGPFPDGSASEGPGEWPPAGGWTPPVEDPLFGPLPTYATGAYPLAGHQQGGYPIAGHLPAGPGAASPAGAPGPAGVPDPAGVPGFTGAPGSWPVGRPGDPGQQAGTGELPTGAEPGPDQTGGYSFRLRTTTSPLPVLAPRPETPAMGQASATAAATAEVPSGPSGSHSFGGDQAGPGAPFGSPAAGFGTVRGTDRPREDPTGPMPIPYPEESAHPEEVPRPLPGTSGSGDRPHAAGLARPARTRVALSRRQADRDDSDHRHDAGWAAPGDGGTDEYGESAESDGGARRFQLPEREGAPGRRLPRSLIAVAAAVALTLVALGAVVVLARGGDGTSAAPTATPAAPSMNPNFINSAASDARPVSANEFFPDREVTVQGRKYTRIASGLVSGCPDRSGELVTALTDEVCTQLVRALYLTTPAGGGPQVLAGVSVFVTDTQTTAQGAATIAAQGRGGVTALPIPAGSIENSRVLGPAGDNSWRAAIARGHYMILTQLAYVDGSQGSPDDPALRNTITDLGLIAAEPIAQRMVAGGTGTGGGAPAGTGSSSSSGPARR